MIEINTSIEIARPQEEVRAVFLDFAKYPEWQHHFTRVEPVRSKAGTDLVIGDKCRVTMKGIGFTATVTENSPSEFRWKASRLGMITGEHAFRFQHSKTRPGQTEFVQSEVFTGWLSGWGVDDRKTRDGFRGFDEGLKRRVEGWF